MCRSDLTLDFEEAPAPIRKQRHKLSDAQVQILIQMREAGKGFSEISRALNIKYDTAKQIYRRYKAGETR